MPKAPLMLHVGSPTPWGRADRAEALDADGHIVWVDTPSHGGLYVSPAARQLMPEPLREIRPWAGAAPDGGAWYEEDCDWAIVALSFPSLPYWHEQLSGDWLSGARRTLARQHPQALAAWELEVDWSELAAVALGQTWEETP